MVAWGIRALLCKHSLVVDSDIAVELNLLVNLLSIFFSLLKQ